MRFDRIICAFFLLFVWHLSLLIVVSGSVIQRSLSDDIKNGISIAGKLFGFDSPTNIAAISNVADLVARAFSNNNHNGQAQGTAQGYDGYKQGGWNDKQSFERRPTQKLESFSDEVPLNQNQNQGSQEENIDDNVIVGTGYNTGGGTDSGTTSGVDHGFLGQVLRVLGMDTSKIGAMAVNGIIFIAQMIGRSLMSAFTVAPGNLSPKHPNENIDISGGPGPGAGARRFSENYRAEQPRALPIVDNAFDWILDKSKQSPFLAQQLNVMLDKELPDRIINYIDDGNNKDQQQETDCIKLLICKIGPIIRGMQRAVSKKMNNDESETNEPDENPSDDNAGREAPEQDYRLNAFFKYLPNVNEFRDNGDICENRFSSCKIF